MPAKPWCDHTGGFESGLRSWELCNCVGRCSQVHSDDEYGPDFFIEVCSWVHVPTAQFFAQPCCSGVTSLETLERIRPRHLEMERVQMMTRCKLTLSRKVREKAKVKTNIREEIARPTRALQTSTRARIVANL